MFSTDYGDERGNHAAGRDSDGGGSCKTASEARPEVSSSNEPVPPAYNLGQRAKIEEEGMGRIGAPSPPASRYGAGRPWRSAWDKTRERVAATEAGSSWDDDSSPRGAVDPPTTTETDVPETDCAESYRLAMARDGWPGPPGAVAVPGPGAADTNNSSRSCTGPAAEAQTDGTNMDVVVVATAVHVDDAGESRANEDGGRFCRKRSLAIVAFLGALGIVAAVVLGAMVATGTFDGGSSSDRPPSASVPARTDPTPGPNDPTASVPAPIDPSSPAPTESTADIPAQADPTQGEPEPTANLPAPTDPTQAPTEPTANIPVPADPRPAAPETSALGFGEECSSTMLLANDAFDGQGFGYSVAVDGDTAVVGTKNRGVYVFVRSGESWRQQAKLSVGVDSVALSGDTVVVGYPWEGDNGPDSGSAFVYVRSNGAWTRQAVLRLEDGVTEDYFGRSVAISGDTAVVSTMRSFHSGAAYVFTRSGGSGGEWSLQAKLRPKDGSPSDRFGSCVSLSGDTAAVGAPWYPDIDDQSGAVYVYNRSGGEWTEQAILLPDDGTAWDRFGVSVAISGGTVVIGAYYDDENGNDSGLAYVFTLSEEGYGWVQEAKLIPEDLAAYDYFGYRVGVSGNTVIVGANLNFDDGSSIASGAAYVFTRSGGEWRQEAKLVPKDGAENDGFGTSVAVSGGTVVVGAHSDEDNGANIGSTHVFEAC